jgi:tetratricopeptide (TPR) repeat protein
MTLKRSPARPGADPRPKRSNGEALEDERGFLLQSMADLDQERADGEVDEEDFGLLKARYGAQLVEVEAALSELSSTVRAGAETPGDAPGKRTGKRRGRFLHQRRVRLSIGIAAALCFVVAASLLAATLAGVRLPGESATGSVSISTAQQESETLTRAAILGSEGQAAEAVQLYDEVLQTDPNQPDALAYEGWLVRLAGLSSKNELVVEKGDASVARAVKVAPSYPDAHALMGVILYEDFARPKAAVAQFRDAVRAGASKSLLAAVADVATRAFAAAKQALPASYAPAAKSATG